MFIQPELEVHSHQGEIVAAARQSQIERAGIGIGRRFEERENRFGVAKNVGRADEAAHRAPGTQHGHFGAQSRGGAFRIGKLMPVPDRAERNVMRHDQADRRLDLVDVGSQQSREHDRRSDRAMHDVVDLVVLERKNFGQAAADFVEKNHRPNGLFAARAAQLGGGDGDGIEIVVAEFAFGVPARGCSRNSCRWHPIRARPSNWPRRLFPAEPKPSNRSTLHRNGPRRRRLGTHIPKPRGATTSARSPARPKPTHRRQCYRDETVRPAARPPGRGRRVCR